MATAIGIEIGGGIGIKIDEKGGNSTPIPITSVTSLKTARFTNGFGEYSYQSVRNFPSSCAPCRPQAVIFLTLRLTTPAPWCIVAA